MIRRAILGVICLGLLWLGAAPIVRSDPGYRRQTPGRGAGRGHNFPPPLSPQEKEEARRRIGITTAQQAQIETLFAQTDQDRHTTFDQLRDLFRQLHHLYDNYDVDPAKEAQLRRQILALQAHLLAIHSANEKKLRTILSRDQFDRMKAMMNEGHRRWNNDDHKEEHHDRKEEHHANQ